MIPEHSTPIRQATGLIFAFALSASGTFGTQPFPRKRKNYKSPLSNLPYAFPTFPTRRLDDDDIAHRDIIAHLDDLKEPDTVCARRPDGL